MRTTSHPALPWPTRFIDVGVGRVHLVDTGPPTTPSNSGGPDRTAGAGSPPLLLLHGTPTWSFLYRHVLTGLADHQRVIAYDHLGFGRSDRPEGWGYRPRDHGKIVNRVVESLELEELILGVHDFGGPIGLSWALDHVERVRGLVLFNTWMWSLEGTSAARMGRWLSGRIGRALYRRNFSPRVLLPLGFADRKRLSGETHRAYLDAFPDPASRHAPWVFARELAASGPWYQELWERRELLSDIPALLLWGMKDPAFGPSALARWEKALPRARIERFEDVGHFPQEEAPQQVVRALREWLANSSGRPGRGDVRS
jgi:pimeloyl-ACP methyl ester carboxylesterase